MAEHPAVTEAREWLGTKYRHQQSVKGIACDCLGLLRGVWRGVCGPEPEETPPYPKAPRPGEERMADAASRNMTSVEIGAALPGDVLIYETRSIQHSAVLIEGDVVSGRMIHAVPDREVMETPVFHLPPKYVFRFPL